MRENIVLRSVQVTTAVCDSIIEHTTCHSHVYHDGFQNTQELEPLSVPSVGTVAKILHQPNGVVF